jgi:hypothetical protein
MQGVGDLIRVVFKKAVEIRGGDGYIVGFL